MLSGNVLLGFLALVLACEALAQQRPGGNGPLPGDPGYNGAVGQHEIPMPRPQPSGEWIKTWGAIANGSNGVGGTSVGMLTKSAAEGEAVARCVSGGGQDCRASFTYYNQCAVILSAISDPVTDMLQGAESIEVATKVGMPKCRSMNNGSECRVVYSACSEAIFNRFR